MQQIKYSINKNWQKILRRPAFDSLSLERKVKRILNAVKKRGDAAVKKFTEEFDEVKLKNFLVTKAEFEEAEKSLIAELKSAIIIAK